MSERFSSLKAIKDFLNVNGFYPSVMNRIFEDKINAAQEIVDLLIEIMNQDPYQFRLVEMAKISWLNGAYFARNKDVSKWLVRNMDYVIYILETNEMLDDLCVDEDVFNISVSYLRVSGGRSRLKDLIYVQLYKNPQIIIKNLDSYLTDFNPYTMVRVMSTLRLVSKKDPMSMSLLLKTKAELTDYLQIKDCDEVEAIKLFISERENNFPVPLHFIARKSYRDQIIFGSRNIVGEPAKRLVFDALIRLGVTRAEIIEYVFWLKHLVEPQAV